MPETLTLRTKILKYLEQENIQQKHVAMLIDENRQYLNEVLNGKKTGTKANLMLITIVKVLGIK